MFNWSYAYRFYLKCLVLFTSPTAEMPKHSPPIPGGAKPLSAGRPLSALVGRISAIGQSGEREPTAMAPEDQRPGPGSRSTRLWTMLDPFWYTAATPCQWGGAMLPHRPPLWTASSESLRASVSTTTYFHNLSHFRNSLFILNLHSFIHYSMP